MGRLLLEGATLSEIFLILISVNRHTENGMEYKVSFSKIIFIALKVQCTLFGLSSVAIKTPVSSVSLTQRTHPS